jgi:hypothetical protein
MLNLGVREVVDIMHRLHRGAVITAVVIEVAAIAAVDDKI